jgi:hypothetical protein
MSARYGQQRDEEGMQMRTGIGIAVVVAIGLIWSVAAMSKLVPVPSEDLRIAATSPHAGGTVEQSKNTSSN